MMKMIKTLLRKYNSLGAPAKASLWFMICGFFQQGISFLTTPLFTRVMTDTEYGSFAIYNSWLSIFQILFSLNLAAGVYTRGLVKHEDNQDIFSSSMTGLSTTCMCVMACVYLIFHNEINCFVGMSTIIMVAMFLEIWGTTTYQFWSNRERVNYRYKKLVLLTLLYVLFRPIMGLSFVLLVDMEYQMEARIVATILVQIFLFAPLFFIILRKGKILYHKEYWAYGLKFNIPLVPHYLSQIILNQSDRIMIERMIGAAEAAYYSVAYTVAVVLLIMSNAISSTMNPWIYKSLKSGNVEEIGKISYVVLGMIAGVNLILVAIAPEAMQILAPENYQVAIYIIPPVTASVYYMFLYNLFATFEFYYEKTNYVMIASVLGAMLNLLLNYIFIPRFGFLAAGYTTLVCYIVYAVGHYCFMKAVAREYLNGEKIYDPRIIIAIGGGLLAVAFLISAFYDDIKSRILIILCLTVFIVGVLKTKKKELGIIFDKR